MLRRRRWLGGSLAIGWASPPPPDARMTQRYTRTPGRGGGERLKPPASLPVGLCEARGDLTVTRLVRLLGSFIAHSRGFCSNTEE
mmetsp:Transcript_26754/g.46886  ORF Transcript_26754/g.46886 Transcript_26754/m.46886 type:complete len:85 (+) Transcript_26754:74-328(+)